MEKIKNLEKGYITVFNYLWHPELEIASLDADIIILDEPTRGIDVGAKSEIHSLMGELVKSGKAVIMISSELPEVIGMSDRILVMHEGKLTGEVNRTDATQDVIMSFATGTA